MLEKFKRMAARALAKRVDAYLTSDKDKMIEVLIEAGKVMDANENQNLVVLDKGGMHQAIAKRLDKDAVEAAKSMSDELHPLIPEEFFDDAGKNIADAIDDAILNDVVSWAEDLEKLSKATLVMIKFCERYQLHTTCDKIREIGRTLEDRLSLQYGMGD